MDIGNCPSKEDMSEEKSESDGGLLSLEDDYTSNTPTASEMITSKIQKYRSWDVSNRVDPLKWWRDNRNAFPILSEVARVYLGVHATSTESERTFSKCGFLKSGRRNRMGSDLISANIYLNACSKIDWLWHQLV
ncbi:hypothetical protein AAMO2058_001657900 [Amorphochlora amoebiformis]